ncbi:LysE family translocator [Deefgea salmonis]|uniref:LysE family translocator n=1 Tax=Deefgea salmonis TaxID=2875502 RepID=A0ABS8BIA3_9NEIS|nr:LysE family translocator [Deefgea salmonis]MCB5195452.1 LysE family translocator [Deefgea salmonis]
MEINLFAIFATVALAHFIALLSPGPDFLLVVKSAVKNKKQVAIGVAIGIASANAVYIALCLIGVGAILASSIVIMMAIKLAGGVFLIYLAVMALKAKKSDYSFLANAVDVKESNESTIAKEFVTGFLSGILNPKNPLFYLSLFTLVLNGDVGLGFKIALGVWMALIVFLWDAFIILVLSHKDIRSIFNRSAFYVDKTAGVILGAFGLTLIYSAIFKANK